MRALYKTSRRWRCFSAESTACKNGPESRFRQDTGNLLAFVALNFDSPLLHRASSSAGSLHLLAELLLLRQPDADEVLDHRHRLSAAPCFLPDNIHAPTILLWRRCWGRGRRYPGWKPGAVEFVEWALFEIIRHAATVARLRAGFQSALQTRPVSARSRPRLCPARSHPFLSSIFHFPSPSAPKHPAICHLPFFREAWFRDRTVSRRFNG
jgi:hypothetical protein